MSDEQWIIVAYEKHDERYFDASTDERWAGAALKLLAERLVQGWYYEPTLDEHLPHSSSPHAIDKAVLALTDGQLDALPDEVASSLLKKRDEDRKRLANAQEAYEEDKAWWDEMNRVVKERDFSFVEVGSKRNREHVPLAWKLLTERIDHEYERVLLLPLEVAEPTEW